MANKKKQDEALAAVQAQTEEFQASAKEAVFPQSVRFDPADQA